MSDRPTNPAGGGGKGKRSWRGKGNGNSRGRGRGGSGRGGNQPSTSGSVGAAIQPSDFPPVGAENITTVTYHVGNANQNLRHQNGMRGAGRGRGNNNHGGRGHGGNAGSRRASAGEKRSQGTEEGSGDDSEEETIDVSQWLMGKPKKKERKFDGPVFGFKKLYKFLDSKPDDVLLSINFEKDDWKDLLESDDLKGERLILVIHVLGEKVCADVPILLQQQANALTACCSRVFTQKLEDIVSKISFGSTLPYRANKSEYSLDTSPLTLLRNIHQICSFIMKTMPSSGIDFFKGIIMISMGASDICDSSSTLKNKFKSLADQIKEMAEKERKKEEKIKRQKEFGFNDDDMAEFDNEAPPDNFKDIEIIPTIEELRRTSEAFLRPNKTSGAYNDSDHYLDVQFRLLREDFVQPLRKGIRTFLKDRHDFITGKKRMPLGEVRLYAGVHIIKVEKEFDNVVYKLQLAEANYKRVKWDKSKRLLTGSLIVLTGIENPFQTDNTHFGVVFSRKVPELEKGIVTVTWEGKPPVYDEDEDYLMFESEVYLEAYRHTLETLKNLELEKFTMKKFIVEACNSVEAPNYITDSPYLLTLKMADGSNQHLSPQRQQQWPTAKEFGFDENQLQAFQAAITKEFTIIQGPPGTGKTFLGLKVAETLLNNSKMWCIPDDPNPITVVCYTNHALDQFLEGILKYYEREQVQAEIIRIGGRCKSESLTKYSLRNVRQRNRRKLPTSFYAAERQAKEEIYFLEDVRAGRMSEVTGLKDVQGIINFEALSVWTLLQPEYPSVIWKRFQDFKWFGLGDNQLDVENLSEEFITNQWFNVRLFPKTAPRKKKEETKENGKVARNTVEGTSHMEEEDGVEEDEEDWDVDELMDNRVLDIEEIFLEAETSSRINMGRRLNYLPNGSVKDCEKLYKHTTRVIQEATRGMNPFQTNQIRLSKKKELTVLDNRRKLLTEIFKLYKEQLLDLPDVSELLNDVREGKTVHFDRLEMAERWAMYFTVVERARVLTAEKVVALEDELSKARKELRNVIQLGDGHILRDCKVVGLTTTGAAKYNNLLRMMKSKIVIVEEAAEVFESHIVTCITEQCEQLILIGDHRQLRPSPTVYDLAVKYHLDLSLFERMINNELHCHQLKMQHRMRPDISDLVVGTIYDELFDDESVKCYPDVSGLVKNVFFITHTEKEKSESDSTSKSNEHEAKFIAKFCRHLVLQGYDPSRITVLTMYTGQMFLLKKEVATVPTCRGVRITCVDNFQGEENDIILLSLVRSNSEGKIGFLSIENRVCVALSRAKHGLYIIGNMDMMEKNKTWRAVKQKLVDKEFIGEGLELECQIHGTRSKVQTGMDFIKFSPEGGCLELCDTELPCSHKCTRVCHILDRDHVEYKCEEACLKHCENKLHPCRGKCFQRCPPCNVAVERTLNCEMQHKKLLLCHVKFESYICHEQVLKTLPCGHEETMACYIKAHEYTCKIKVTKKLPCQHERVLECHVDPSSVRCKIMVPKVLPCGHTQNEECCKDSTDVKCVTMVPKKIEKCGHEAQVKCSEKDKQVLCRGPCTTRLECGHQCVKICHVDEDPHHNLYQCKKDCARECADNHRCKVKHACHLRCPPCKEKIMRTLPCGHQVELECHVDINFYECLESCERSLQSCGHKCPNLCFQPCGPCQTKVHKVAPCRHSQLVMCGSPALKENCEHLVPPKALPLCGHRNTQVPCKHDQASPEELVKYCQRPCDHVFTSASGIGCNHKCSGNCSSCFQGRIHKKCQSECGKALVCGHRCEVPCSAVCPPCQKNCLMKCEHTECKKKCGDPCSICKEKCTWVCPHAKCTKLCGEKCNREPCNEPCPKKLKCGHDCVGYCGEPCPPLCRTCNFEELTEILFGNEDEEDARFVYLPDCGHCIEAEALETLLKNYGSGQIKSKECPRCKTPIRNCRRFGNLIRQFYEDVRKVKMRSFGNRANSDAMRDRWIAELNQGPVLERVFPQLHFSIRGSLLQEIPDKNGRVTIKRLMIDEFSMRSLDFIAKSSSKAAEDLHDLNRSGKIVTPYYEKVVGTYRKILTAMLERHPLSRQEVMDFNAELDRIDYFKQLMMRRSLPNCNRVNIRAYTTYQTAKKYVVSPLPLSQIRKDTFIRLLKELDESLKSGLGISDRERIEILQAMGMGQGHWFKCPNGHIYVITECGGAMVQSRCNECGAAIGGGQHRLRADNALAREMDGAPGPAWPNALQH